MKQIITEQVKTNAVNNYTISVSTPLAGTYAPKSQKKKKKKEMKRHLCNIVPVEWEKEEASQDYLQTFHCPFFGNQSSTI